MVVTGENVSILEQIFVVVEYQCKKWKLPLVVLSSNTTFIPLLGNNWLSVLNPNWKNRIDTKVIVKTSATNKITPSVSSPSINKMQIEKLIFELKQKFNGIFKVDPNSCVRGFKADIKLKKDVKPVFCRVYDMPYALKYRVGHELLNMVSDGVLCRGKSSNWASPIVVVPKKIYRRSGSVLILRGH